MGSRSDSGGGVTFVNKTINLNIMTEFTLKQLLTNDGFITSEEDPDTLFKPNGTSIKFYVTSEGIPMFNVVDTTKQKYKWMYMRFRIDFINSYEDLLFLFQGSTVKGY